jgi:NADPH:quinone reductase-like Zn-dependent oxidoreductase
MMKAIHAINYGSTGNLHLQINVPKPVNIPKGKILIKTEAVALAPGDARVLSGKTRELQGPASMPYIPGGDCSGTIVDMGNESSEKLGYTLGDRVAARFVDGPAGALAEYALISPKMCDKVPDEISSIEAAALASSATIAVSLSKKIKENERVLVLGAGGGVGSHLCQLLRLRKVSFIAGVSRNTDRLLRDLNCDQAIDYTKEDPFSVTAWKENQFDVIVDLSASGAWSALMKLKEDGHKLVVKPASEGGRYITLSPDEAWYELHSVWAALKTFLFTSLWRAFYSRAFWNRSSMPSYTFSLLLVNDIAIMEETMNLAKDGKLKACIDESGPFPFTTAGVRNAFDLQYSRHVKGKAVIDLTLN